MARARATAALVVLASCTTTTMAIDHPRMRSNYMHPTAGIIGSRGVGASSRLHLLRSSTAHVDSPDWGYIAPLRRLGSIRHGHDVHVSSNEGAGGDPGVFDVRAFGAVGDGVSDDTAPFMAALSAATAAGGTGVLQVPPGAYVITKTLNAPPTLSVQGFGWSSNLLWAHDADLLVWDSPSPRVSVSDLAVTSVGETKSPNSTALRLGVSAGSGAQRVEIDHVLVYAQVGGVVPNTSRVAVAGGSAIDLGPVSDTSTVRDCVLWMFGTGTGIKIGRGSEVRIEGGRVIGPNHHGGKTVADAMSGPVGIHVTGNNGGVHVQGTDVIGLGVGMLMDNANGQGSNREIFITQATFDSDGVGLLVRDNSYVSVAGCWAASSDVAQIWLAPSATGALMSVAGGTIFNGGAYYQLPDPASPCPLVGGCNGLVVDAGTFLLTGVAVRNNHGVGVLVRRQGNAHVSHFTVTGCQLMANGAAFIVEAASFAITGNVLYSNANASVITAVSGTAPAPIIANNVGLPVGVGYRTL